MKISFIQHKSELLEKHFGMNDVSVVDQCFCVYGLRVAIF